MSTTTTTQKTLAEAPTGEQESDINLSEIVAQTVPIGDKLPDFDEFNAVCKATRDTIERTVEQEAI
ncbi:hypothetical protein [Natrialba sp. SSL1]|uniref:hypothetical protein n=1 Tax=Natrialba sp. SSL1 TaxID=1869245 RepID=UPI0008F95883|nr:hypothetical protein [Natrialba sp. SSL1]OIB59381.1 hypothetical protein BBD46_01510 [Natrialba sp. SSL1]